MPIKDAASFSSVHLLPKPPRGAGAVGTTVKLAANDQYLIDGRVRTLQVAFGWETQADIDASVAVYDGKFKRIDAIWWDKRVSKYCSVKHTGDERTGDKKGDKEVIEVGLSELPLNVHYMFFTLSIYSKGKTMKDARAFSVRLLYPQSPPTPLELANFSMGDLDGTSAVAGLLTRKGAWWTFTALSKATKGRTIKEISYYTDFKSLVREPSVPAVSRLLRVWVPEARDVAASDASKMFGKNKSSDCFVMIECKYRKFTSDVVEKTLSPKWKMKKMELGEATESDHSLVEMKLFDQDPSNDDDFLGAAYITLGGMIQAGLGQHEFVFSLGPSLDDKEKPKRGVSISGQLVIQCEVLPVES